MKVFYSIEEIHEIVRNKALVDTNGSTNKIGPAKEIINKEGALTGIEVEFNKPAQKEEK